MGTYRKEWHCCDSVTETEGYEPESCPFCTECTAAPARTVLTDERVEIKDTDAARAYLLQWMVANFPTDQSFGVYIQTQLAGDFAYQLARALAATPVAAQAGQVAVPEDVARDAARYRWLRGPSTDIANVIDKEFGPGMWEYKAGEELDTAIDEAMQAPSPEKESK